MKEGGGGGGKDKCKQERMKKGERQGREGRGEKKNEGGS